MHHFKNENNRHQIKLCSNKGGIFHGCTLPGLTDEEAIKEGRRVWAENFIRHDKWIEIIDADGNLILQHPKEKIDNLK